MPKKQDLCRHIGINPFQGQSSHPLYYTAREGAQNTIATQLKKKEYPTENFLGMMGTAGITFAG
jgi:hypothetical protein